VNTNFSDSLMIQAYLEGRLDYKNMHRLEKQALDDPFLWEALEGYAQVSNPGTELSILQRQLHERIVHLQENKNVFHLTWQRLSIAATASVLFITAGILFWLNMSRSRPLSEKQVEVTLLNNDSLKSEIRAYEGRSLDSKQLRAISSEGVKRSDNNSSNFLSKSISAASEQGVQPVTGWDIYRKYLEDNMRRPASEPQLKGSVLLSFKVDENGRATEFHVLKGIGEAYNMEAIRLVKEGPLWKTRPDRKIITGRLEIVF